MTDHTPGSAVAGVPAMSSGIWSKRWFRLVAWVTAGAVSVGIGFGLTSTVRGTSSAIPSPPARNATFVEDFNGIGQDNQTNVLSATAPGVVAIRSGGKRTEAGVVITRSGFVLASDRGVGGTLTARFAMSGRAYPARVVGTDPAADLALLQLSGSSDFPVAQLGNSDDVHLGDVVNSVGTTGTVKGVVLSTGSVIGLGQRGTVEGRQLVGLMEVNSLDRPDEEIGGPLANLSGQVLGIGVAGADQRIPGSGYVLPIDAALAIASEIAG
jgi:putative serine protease PepD